MDINIGNEEVKRPYIQEAGIYNGVIAKVDEVTQDKDGNVLPSPYLGVLFETKAGTHYEKFYVSEKAVSRLKELWTSLMDSDLAERVESSLFQQLVGKKVSFMLVPTISGSNGKVYYNCPFANFIRLEEYGNTLKFSAKQKETIAEVAKLESTTDSDAGQPNPENDLPF